MIPIIFDQQLILIISLLILGVVLFFLGYFLQKISSKRRLDGSEHLAKKLIEDAKREAENKKKEIELGLKDEIFRVRKEFEDEVRDRRQELVQQEKRFTQKEENLEKKIDFLEKRDQQITAKEQDIKQKEERLIKDTQELESILENQKRILQKVSGLTIEEAKKLLLKKVEEDISQDVAVRLRQAQAEVEEKSEKKAREIITYAIQRCAVDQVVESTVSVVHLPNDEMKGRIIGREGRNIRALEAATGIDIIIDDTPEAVVLSGFDKVRREIARIALENLIADGRIHPTRIEELVEKARQEVQASIKEAGEQAIFETGLPNIHPELIKYLGRLKYRTSYGQNVLEHSKEVAYVMGILAAELGLDIKLAKRVGLLHDIGKAVDHEVEGPHALIGADLARKYGEVEVIINAIAAHHNDCENQSLFAVLVQAADAVSASRPGARRETIDIYVKRLSQLEEIAKSFKGVEKSYAIQAGREIRVVVEPSNINDDQTFLLARDIAKKIQDDMEYPGQVKVTVIRETRAVEYAK